MVETALTEGGGGGAIYTQYLDICKLLLYRYNTRSRRATYLARPSISKSSGPKS